jgi:hypothetical protein
VAKGGQYCNVLLSKQMMKSTIANMKQAGRQTHLDRVKVPNLTPRTSLFGKIRCYAKLNLNKVAYIRVYSRQGRKTASRQFRRQFRRSFKTTDE